MKEFNLTQSYGTIEEMVNSGEVTVYKEELKNSAISEYAIISRIGNRYDLDGNRIEGFAHNPYLEKIKEIKEEETDMKYAEIEALINAEIEKAVAEVKADYELKISAYENELAVRDEQHAKELAEVKEQAKAELIAKLNG